MIKLKTQIVKRLEVSGVPDIIALLADKAFYRETYTEFDNQVWFPKSSITDASDEFKATEIYSAIKEIFEQNPEFNELSFV